MPRKTFVASALLPLTAVLPTIVWAQSGYEFDLYGHLHGAYQGFDDGQLRTETLVDPATSISRIGFFLRPLSPDNGLSFQFETSIGFRPSDGTSQTSTPDAWDWSRRNLRQVQVIYASRLGTFRAGQGSMPLDGAAEADPGGYNAVAKSNITEGYGAYILRSSTGALSDTTIKDTFDSFDGDRRFRLRWDSPDFAGISLALAYGTEVLSTGNDNTYYDIALRYDGGTERVRIKAAIGSGWENGDGFVDRVTVGSLGVIDTETGVNGSVAIGQSATDADPAYLYLRAGWNRRFLPVGDSGIALEYFTGRDYEVSGSHSDMWGIALVQAFEAQNLTVYAGYRSFAFDSPGPDSFQDAQGVQVGATWKF